MSTVIDNPPAPGTPEWREMITASKISAMLTDKETGEYLGLGYVTAFEMWSEMRGEWQRTIDAATQEMFDDAHDAEDYAANVWLRCHPGWKASRGEVAYTDESLEFPNLVTLDRRMVRGRAKHIVEVKRPRVERGLQPGWQAQVIFQMGVSGIHSASLVEVPIYGRPVIHEVEWDGDLYAAICEDAAHFHNLVATGTAPALGDSKDAKAILAERNPVNATTAPVEVPDMFMHSLMKAWKQQAEADSAVRFWENKVAEAMGDSGKAEFEGRKVASRTAGRFSQSRVPADYKPLLKAEEFMTPKFDTAKFKTAHSDVYRQACGVGSFKFERKEWIGE